MGLGGIIVYPLTLEVGMNRFWEKVDKSGDCWEWLAYKDSAGYGNFSIKNVTHYAHRVSYNLSFGEIPAGMVVGHHCDNPSCVNQAHLFLGNHSDNVADKVSKGRQCYGERNGRSKLTDNTVRKIREYAKRLPITKVMLGKIFGVSDITIHEILSGKKWSHVE